MKNTGVNAESLQFRRWRPQRCTETCQAGREQWGRRECRARAQWEMGDPRQRTATTVTSVSTINGINLLIMGAGRPRRRRRARKRAISVSLVEHAESHRAKYRSILPARQAGPSSAASARRVMEMSMRCSSVRLVQYLGGVVWPMPGDRSNCGCRGRSR